MKVLVTGSTGFIGSALCRELERRSISFTRVSRYSMSNGLFPRNKDSDLIRTGVTKNHDVVIHCAALNSSTNGAGKVTLEDYRKVNVEGTYRLAKEAVAIGVKRFIFLSSIKVNGERTNLEPFTAQGSAGYESVYGQTKYEAEKKLFDLGRLTGMEIIVIRPPLVYGPGVKGNFEALIKLINKGIPLPFGAIDNHRSLVALDNLINLITTCIEHPEAANQTFLVSDDDDVSTTELLRRMQQAFGKKKILIPVPKWFMKMATKAFSNQKVTDSFFASLQVDIKHTKNTLGWSPPVTMEQQLRKIANQYNEY